MSSLLGRPKKIQISCGLCSKIFIEVLEKIVPRRWESIGKTLKEGKKLEKYAKYWKECKSLKSRGLEPRRVADEEHDDDDEEDDGATGFLLINQILQTNFSKKLDPFSNEA